LAAARLVAGQLTPKGFVDRLRRCEGPSVEFRDGGYQVVHDGRREGERYEKTARVRIPRSNTARAIHVPMADIPGWIA